MQRINVKRFRVQIECHSELENWKLYPREFYVSKEMLKSFAHLEANSRIAEQFDNIVRLWKERIFSTKSM